MRVASIGECMVELREQPDGTLQRSWGGDTLNTAVYLARLGVAVDYVTALGDDAWSDEMLAGWRAEGIGTSHVVRLPARLPGLYIIQTDPAGERRFLYWRDRAAARDLFSSVQSDIFDGFDLLYFSGISLSIYPDSGRENFLRLLSDARRRGAQIAFDTNFRPRGWPDLSLADRLYEEAFALADVILASAEDLFLLFGAEGEERLMRHAEGRELVLKMNSPTSKLVWDGGTVEVSAPPVRRVVDTTAAGDSFAAAYLAARLRGEPPAEAARMAHDLAGIVVGHPGAIVPRAAMTQLLRPQASL